MANTHDLFKAYNKSIRLSDDNRERLLKARGSLRDRMKAAYSLFPLEERKTHDIEFQSQGSFVMDTIIKPHSTDFDLDDGVYFHGNLDENQRAETQEFHDLIVRAIDRNREIEDIIDKPTCVRVKYHKGESDLGYHIDLPIYYAEHFETPELAHTKEGWLESSPVEFVAWFEEKTGSGFNKAFLYETRKYQAQFDTWLSDMRKKDCQLRRLVRYLKSWADIKRKEMPSGIIISILCANNYVENERDDKALKDLLENINEDLESNGFQCLRPTPLRNEDLFETTSQSEKKFFKSELEAFITSANQAINNPNPREACLKWKKHLGPRFPCHLAKDEIEGSNVYAAPAIKRDNSKSAKHG